MEGQASLRKGIFNRFSIIFGKYGGAQGCQYQQCEQDCKQFLHFLSPSFSFDGRSITLELSHKPHTIFLKTEKQAPAWDLLQIDYYSRLFHSVHALASDDSASCCVCLTLGYVCIPRS